MSDSQKPLHGPGVLDFIHQLAANGASGRLEIEAGLTRGAFSFKKGKLVDASMGHVTGFQAVNAVASMRDARFNFDPTVAPPAFSSITANERVVLKQFFGIETVDPEDLVVHVINEATVVRPSAVEVPAEIPSVLSYAAPRRHSYVGPLALAAVAIIFIAAAALVTYVSRERNSSPPPLTATTTRPTAPTAAPAIEEPAQPVAQPAAQPKRELSRQTTQDLTGQWKIVNTVQTTSYRSFQNLQIGFDLAIDQDGTSFTGKGQKVSENGRSLPAASRTPIQVKGSIEGDRVEATFYEDGALRKTNGRFVWRVDRAGRGLTGIFATTAARSSGKSAATRSL